MRRRQGVALVVLGLALRPEAALAGNERDPTDASLLIEASAGPLDPELVLAVARGGPFGVATLLPRLDRLGPSERSAIAAAYSAPYSGGAARHPRVIELLARLVRDEDAGVRRAAIETLGRSRSERAGVLLLSRLEASPTEREELLHALVQVAEGREDGRAAGAFEAEALRVVAPLAGDAQPAVRREAVRVLAGLADPRARAILERATGDDDASTRRTALRALERAQRATPGPSEPPRTMSRRLLLLTMVLSAILGVVFFLWAFRLLRLRALLEGTGVARARSVALGTAAVRGEAQPSGDYLRHPYTGELCVYYRGADERHPDRRFYVEDETGRLLVDPRGAVWLSEDGVVSPGERIHLVGTVRAGGGAPILGRRPGPPPGHQRLISMLVGVALAGDRATRRLFDDPHDVFWIWDDARARPMSSPREVALVFLAALLGGAWLVVFSVAALQLLG